MSGEKVDAFMPLWIGAYLADTLTLTTLQHGAYLLLLMAYWRERAPLPDDDEALRSIAKLDRADWKKIRPVLARKFRVADGVWSHKRVEQELIDAVKRKEKASGKAKAAADARWNKGGKHPSGNAPSIGQALPEDCPTPPPTPVVVEPSGSTPTVSGATHTAEGEYIGGATETVSPTVYGEIARAIRTAGIAAIDTAFPKFRVLVEAGATADEFVRLVPQTLEAGGGSFAYLVGAVAGERKRAAQLAGQVHRGAMPHRITAAEQRVLDAVPSIAAAHLRPLKADPSEVIDVAP